MTIVLFVPLTMTPLVTGDHVTGGARLAVWFNTRLPAFVGHEITIPCELATICKPGGMMSAAKFCGCKSV